MTGTRRRIKHRTTRTQVTLQLRRAVGPTFVYLLGLVAGLGCAAYIAHSLTGGGGLVASRTYRFAVQDATGVVAGRDEVRYEGIPAGTINGVHNAAGHAVLTISLQKKYGVLYRNATAQLRPNTPLDDMYLDIVNPGTPAHREASAGQPLPMSQTLSSVNISSVLDTFSGSVKANLEATLSQLGQGLGDRGAALRSAFVKLVPFIEVAGRISQQIAVRSGETRTLIHNTRSLTAELGRRQTALSSLVTAGGRTLDTVEASAAGLNGTLAQLPPAIASLNQSFASVRRTLPSVDTAVRRLGPVAAALHPALTSLARFGTAATPALRVLTPTVGRLRQLVATLAPLARPLRSAFTSLRTQTTDLNTITTDLAECGTAIQRFFQWTQSVFALGDSHGESPRGDAAFGLDSPGLVHDPNVTMPPTCSHAQIEGGTPTPLEQP